MKKLLSFTGTIFLLFLSLMLPVSATDSHNANVILMIPDGQSIPATTLARWYKGSSLAIDEMDSGSVRTYSMFTPITDSAAAATAMATGQKTYNGFIGVLLDSNAKKPIANIIEAARLKNKSTGIVCTSEVMHATPSAFSAHYPGRNSYDNLSEQQVYQGVDVVLGGGRQYFKEKRLDGENLIDEIKELGYEYITTPEQMKQSTSTKIWGMFADADLDFDFDRDPVQQPSIAEMTEKALQILSKNKNGFFLIVEGSKVDWAAHSNDPIGIISESLAFDNAVKIALDFAKNDTNTVVLTATDHGNGGISIGESSTNGVYDQLALSQFIDILKGANCTGAKVENLMRAEPDNVHEALLQYGIFDATYDEIATLQALDTDKVQRAVGLMMSKRAHIGWNTTGHTGEDVPFYIYSPFSQLLRGNIQNTDIAKYIEKIMGLNLAEATDMLFVPVRKEFEKFGAEVTWRAEDPNNPEVVVKKNQIEIVFPINKNKAIVNGQEMRLNGVVVNNGTTTFVPKMATELIY